MTDKTPTDRLVELMEFNIETGVTLRDTAGKILEAINEKPADYLQDNRLGVAMGLLRDNMMQFNRELNQDELDLVREVKK